MGRLCPLVGEQQDAADAAHVHLAPVRGAPDVVERDREPVDPGRDRQRPVEPILVPLVVRRVVDANRDRQRRVEIRDDGDHQAAIAAPVGIRLHDADAGIGARLQIEPRERFGERRVEARRPRLHGQAAVVRLDEPPLPPGAVEGAPASASRGHGRRRPPSSLRGSPRTRRAGARRPTTPPRGVRGPAAGRPCRQAGWRRGSRSRNAPAPATSRTKSFSDGSRLAWKTWRTSVTAPIATVRRNARHRTPVGPLRGPRPQQAEHGERDAPEQRRVPGVEERVHEHRPLGRVAERENQEQDDEQPAPAGDDRPARAGLAVARRRCLGIRSVHSGASIRGEP